MKTHSALRNETFPCRPPTLPVVPRAIEDTVQRPDFSLDSGAVSALDVAYRLPDPVGAPVTAALSRDILYGEQP